MSLDQRQTDRRNGSERRLAISSQAPPTGDGAVVLHDVVAKIDTWLNNCAPNKTEGLLALREDLIARAHMGQAKYGTMLRINNGRRAIVDVYQEVLDALMYSNQARMQGDKTIAASYVELLLELGRQLAAELDQQ